MYSIGLFQARPSYMSGTTRRSTPWIRACSRTLLHNPALARRGKEDLVHKLLAGMLEELVQRSHNIAGTRREPGPGAGKINEALECVAQMPNAFQVMAQRVRLRTGAHYQHIARSHPAVVPAIKQYAVHHRRRLSATVTSPRSISTMPRGMSSSMKQVECAGEQKAEVKQA